MTVRPDCHEAVDQSAKFGSSPVVFESPRNLYSAVEPALQVTAFAVTTIFGDVNVIHKTGASGALGGVRFATVRPW